MDEPLGLLETTGFTPAMVALDVMAKASPLVVLQAEVNDFLGICIKVVGPLAGIETALEGGRFPVKWDPKWSQNGATKNGAKRR